MTKYIVRGGGNYAGGAAWPPLSFRSRTEPDRAIAFLGFRTFRPGKRLLA